VKTQTKSIIKAGLFSGIIFASGMAGFDYADGENFNIWKFIFYASFFGIFMGLMTHRNIKKTARKNKTTK